MNTYPEIADRCADCGDVALVHELKDVTRAGVKTRIRMQCTRWVGNVQCPCTQYVPPGGAP